MSEQQSTGVVARAWQAARTAAEDVREAVIDTAEAVRDAASYIAKAAVDAAAVNLVINVVTLAKFSKLIETCITAAAAKPGGDPADGRYLGKDCPDTRESMPAEGVRPFGCENSARSFPKVIYTNGINTDTRVACQTIHAIADSRCVEVIGIYNATDGPVADMANANLSIEGRRNDPAAITLSKTISDFAERGESVTLYAHSEGGLNSIVGLRHAYDEMKEESGAAYANTAMQNVTVYSFGTAETGWPDGPSYHQYTNATDPVPHAILQAQFLSDNRKLNTREAANTQRDRFAAPFWNPIDAHSMDLYLDRLNSDRPVIKGPDGSCCG
jgi:hypothetical protein